MSLRNYLHVFIALNLVIFKDFSIIVRVFVLLTAIIWGQLEFVCELAKRVGGIFGCLLRCVGGIFGCISGPKANPPYTKKMRIGKGSPAVSLASYF